jgi:hypothetical protein
MAVFCWEKSGRARFMLESKPMIMELCVQRINIQQKSQVEPEEARKPLDCSLEEGGKRK